MKENFLKFGKLATTMLVLIYGLFLSGSITQMNKPEPIVQAHAEIKKIVDPKQVACMAKNIFYEAGGESVLGQAAVARVVMNRVQHGFGKNPCEVVYQTTHLDKINTDGLAERVKLCQFSWVCEGKSEPNKNSQRYIQAQQVAYEVMVNDGYNDVVPKSTLFFHNIHVDPMWPYKQVKRIGNHIFYSKHKKSKSDV
jgi:spore germination cell wall hydrolase CwlJ-like protein